MNEIDHFMPILMKREEEAEMTPLVSHGPSHFLWIKHSNLYCIHLYTRCSSCKIPVILKSLLQLWMRRGVTVFSVSCASSQFHLGSPLSAAGSSSDSVSQHVERMCTTSVWLVWQTCTWLIQHLLQFRRSLILISFTSRSSSSLLSSSFTHCLVTLSWNPQRVWVCGLFQHTRRCYFLMFLLPVVAMTKKNANAALVYSFLYKIVQVGFSF